MAAIRLKPISEQVVVIMGASSGIGRGAALAFARRGARLVVAARSEPALQSLVQEIRELGGAAEYVVAEVTEFTQVQAVADAAAERYGRLDTWVHAAGVGLWSTFEETTPTEWQRVVDVNLNGQAYGAMAALPHLRQAGGGALIHISSVEARIALPYQSAYVASKHGITGLLRSLRREMEHDGAGISVTEIMPSGTNTPIFEKARTRLGVTPRPLPPMYQPEIVVDAILYAAEHPVPEVICGGISHAGIITQAVAPRVMNAYLRLAGFRLQYTDQPKRSDAPSSLFTPLERDTRVRANFGESRSWSAQMWLELHPGAKRILAGLAVGAAAAVLAGAFRSGRSVDDADE